jgi:hypothetical protein
MAAAVATHTTIMTPKRTVRSSVNLSKLSLSLCVIASKSVLIASRSVLIASTSVLVASSTMMKEIHYASGELQDDPERPEPYHHNGAKPHGQAQR